MYKNAFATNFKISKNNVKEIVRDGRTRWKVENENNNVLKTKVLNLVKKGVMKKGVKSKFDTLFPKITRSGTVLHQRNGKQPKLCGLNSENFLKSACQGGS